MQQAGFSEAMRCDCSDDDAAIGRAAGLALGEVQARDGATASAAM